LEVGYVVTAEHWRVEVEVAIAEAVAGLHEGCMGGIIDRSMFIKAPFGLEGQEGPDGIGAENSVNHLMVVHRVASVGQTTVQVVDRRILRSGHSRHRLP